MLPLPQSRIHVEGTGKSRGLPRVQCCDITLAGIVPLRNLHDPEISFVGATEEDLTSKGVPYEIGKAAYREVARGQIVGDSSGILKLVFHRDTHELLGVHIVGDGAVELVHIGQAILSMKGTIDYFVNTVFNYPTLAECYKNAALDGINRLSA
jgi:NAD(P) transhydrogenase